MHFCKEQILCVKKSTHLETLYGELGIYPMKIRRRFITPKYWSKILKSENSSYVEVIYNMQQEVLKNNNAYNGLSCTAHVKQLLDELGFSYLWINQDRLPISSTQLNSILLSKSAKQCHYTKTYIQILTLTL